MSTNGVKSDEGRIIHEQIGFSVGTHETHTAWNTRFRVVKPILIFSFEGDILGTSENRQQTTGR